MVFSEQLKLAVKKKAHFCCCLCHVLYVEIHHIVPQADGGADSEDNAAPLCPSCHEAYGANPEKRKFIREVRDFWYELCGKRYSTDPSKLDEISQKLAHAVTKADLDEAISKIIQLMRVEASKEERPVKDRAQEVARLGSMLAPGVGVNRCCKKCGTAIGLFIGDQGRCPNCKTPW